jgi:uncharacterized protein YgiM (DUF1202 family)
VFASFALRRLLGVCLLLGLVMAACLPSTEDAADTLAADTLAADTLAGEAAPVAATAPPAQGALAGLLNRPVATPARPQPTLPTPLATVLATVVASATQPVTTAVDSLSALLPTVTPTPAATATPTAAPPAADLPPATATPTPAPSLASGLTAAVNAPLVNVRGGPGTNYPVVGEASQGATLTVVGRTETGDWLRVCCLLGEGTESWIRADFLLMDLPSRDALAGVPVAEIPPTPQAPAVAAGGASCVASAAELAAAPAAGLPGPGSFAPAIAANPLTGLPWDGSRANQRPVIVCINNDFAARPQFGTSQADVVYEYLMEGYGITRFSAIFYGSDVGQVGPVRSARLINYYMGALYDAGLVCSGASDPVRYSLKHEAPFPYLDIDLDDPNNTRYTVSIGSDYRTRLRADTSRVSAWLAGAGLQKAAALRGFTFGGVPGGGAPATSISIPYPRATGSQVSYVYDAGSGRYLRSLGGAAHLDGNTGAQLALDNVVVQVVAHEATNIVEDSLGSTSIRLNLFGSGAAWVFRDGQAFAGTWRSDSRGDLPRFYDAAGNEIALKSGKTWISVVPGTYSIAYQ